MSMVAPGTALCVPGNHDMKLMRKLRGKDVQHHARAAPSRSRSCEREPPEFRDAGAPSSSTASSATTCSMTASSWSRTPGMKEAMQGRGRASCASSRSIGETTGETDEYGLPVRYHWAPTIAARRHVVYGHTPVPEAEWLNNTICIDTGCVFGGKLTALRWPGARARQRAGRAHLLRTRASRFSRVTSRLHALYRPAAARRCARPRRRARQAHRVDARCTSTVTIREENAIAALEVMSRFAVNPKWLIYLPPTMSPSETTTQPGLLEHPAEAFAYFRNEGVPTVVCEEKHMGSRAVVDRLPGRRGRAAAASASIGRRRGMVYTRTGRRFFDDAR